MKLNRRELSKWREIVRILLVICWIVGFLVTLLIGTMVPKIFAFSALVVLAGILISQECKFKPIMVLEIAIAILYMIYLVIIALIEQFNILFLVAISLFVLLIMQKRFKREREEEFFD